MKEENYAYPNLSNEEGFQDYRVMWIQVSFDLPTKSLLQKRHARLFRKKLIQSGFSMVQWSKYERYVVGHAKLNVYKRRIINALPPKGDVEILVISDSTYGNIERFHGKHLLQQTMPPGQLYLF